MTCLVPKQHAEGILLIFGNKVDGLVGEDIRNIPLFLHHLAVNVQLGIVVDALPLEAEPVVESWTRASVVIHVPLPDQRGFIAHFLQRLRKLLQVRLGILNLVIAHPVNVRIGSGQDRRAARRTERRGDLHIIKHRTFVGQSLKVRRLQKIKAVMKNGVRRHIIHHHK